MTRRFFVKEMGTLLPWAVAFLLPKCPLCLGALGVWLLSCRLDGLIDRRLWLALGAVTLAWFFISRARSTKRCCGADD